MSTAKRLSLELTEARGLLRRFNRDMTEKLKELEDTLAGEMVASNLSDIRRLMTESFNQAETAMMIFELGVSGKLEEGTLEQVHIELISYFDRRNELSILWDYISIQRPNVDWPFL